MNKEVIDTLCYLRGCFKQMSLKEITKTINNSYKLDLTEEKVISTLRENSNLIKDYRKGGTKAVKKALEIGSFNYSTLYDRVKVLNEIILMGKEGFSKEVVTGKGELIETNYIDPKYSLDAVRILNELLSRFDEDDEEDNYTLDILPDF